MSFLTQNEAAMAAGYSDMFDPEEMFRTRAGLVKRKVDGYQQKEEIVTTLRSNYKLLKYYDPNRVFPMNLTMNNKDFKSLNATITKEDFA